MEAFMDDTGNLAFHYEASAFWTAGRNGLCEGKDIPEPMSFSAPPAFHGERGHWTPEHFLLAAVASCFVITFRAIAEHSDFPFESLGVFVGGNIGREDGKYRFTDIKLKVKVGLPEHVSSERAMRLIDKTERNCLIMRSLNAQVVIIPEIRIHEAELVF
jgi:peroxiredoxin-like protein